MNAQEMNIEVMQGTQKLSANRTRKLLDQEIDWTLNRMVEKLMNAAISENRYGYYEINERYAQAIAPLKEVNIAVPAFRDSNDFTKYRAILPADFRYLVSPGAVVGRACDNPTPADNPTSTQTLNIYAWDLRTTKTVGPFWQTFSLVFSGGSISNSTFDGWTGYETKQELFQFANLLQESLWAEGINAYYEEYDGLYRPGFLIIPATAMQLTSVTIDGNLIPSSTLRTSSVTLINPAKVITSPARVVRGSVSHNIRTTPYFGSRDDSPLLEEQGIGIFQVYADKTFTVRGLEVTYLRKPRKIDLSLQRGCDLHPSYHKQICDMAVEDILNMIGNPSWQAKAQEVAKPIVI